MFNSSAFDYINVLDKAADASWIRNEAISNNIANFSIFMVTLPQILIYRTDYIISHRIFQ